MFKTLVIAALVALLLTCFAAPAWMWWSAGLAAVLWLLIAVVAPVVFVIALLRKFDKFRQTGKFS